MGPVMGPDETGSGDGGYGDGGMESELNERVF